MLLRHYCCIALICSTSLNIPLAAAEPTPRLLTQAERRALSPTEYMPYLAAHPIEDVFLNAVAHENMNTVDAAQLLINSLRAHNPKGSTSEHHAMLHRLRCELTDPSVKTYPRDSQVCPHSLYGYIIGKVITALWNASYMLSNKKPWYTFEDKYTLSDRQHDGDNDLPNVYYDSRYFTVNNWLYPCVTPTIDRLNGMEECRRKDYFDKLSLTSIAYHLAVEGLCTERQDAARTLLNEAIALGPTPSRYVAPWSPNYPAFIADLSSPEARVEYLRGCARILGDSARLLSSRPAQKRHIGDKVLAVYWEVRLRAIDQARQWLLDAEKESPTSSKD